MAYQIGSAPAGPQPMPQPRLTPDAGTRTSTGARVTPEWTPQTAEAWGRMRRRVDVVRSGTGRVTTVAGTAAAVSVVIAPGALAVALAGTAALTAAGVATLRLQMPHAGHQKATATTLYAVPGVALAALMAAGAAWGGAVLLAVAVWAAGTWLLRPARVARRMAVPPPPPPADTTVDDGLQVVEHDHPAAAWWAVNAAADGGPAPGTVLEGIERSGEAAMTATIRATVSGEPVPEISVRRLSALMDVPEDQIAIGPVPGRGAGVRRLTVGTPDRPAGADPATVWAERIAPLAMPGAVLTSVRVGKPGAAPTATGPAADAVDLSKEDA